jgi:hypothetical protein
MPRLPRDRLDRLTNGVDDGSGRGDDRRVIDRMRLDFRFHALSHEALGGRWDHVIMLGDQVPGRNFLPQHRPRRRDCHAGEPQWPLRGLKHGQVFRRCVLCERLWEGVIGEPKQVSVVRRELRRLRAFPSARLRYSRTGSRANGTDSVN